MVRCSRVGWLIVMIAAAALAGCTSGRILLSTVVHNFPDLDDHRIFANRSVAQSEHASPLRTIARVPRFMAGMRVPDETGTLHPLEQYLESTRTVAFLLVQDERIVYERYAPGYDERSLLNSFSIAKPIVAALVGIAASEGLIPSLDATVASYRPDLAASPYGAVSLRSLLTMTSGMGPGAWLMPERASYYYASDLREVVGNAVRDTAEGARWRYNEADVQVLGQVLEAAVGRTVSEYLAEKLWRPVGMEAEALWALDREGGSEKTFCCISARARDFARLGRLFAARGEWNGQQLVPLAWAENTVLPGVSGVPGYKQRHLWWYPAGSEGDFYAYGHNGQYLYVHPATRTVIVKFSQTKRQDPVPMFRALAAALAVPAHAEELARLDTATVARR